jgi:hypothetical protein
VGRLWRYVLWVKAHPDFNGGAWAKEKSVGELGDRKPPTFEAVGRPISATRYKKKELAEGAAIILTTAFPHTIGRVEIQEYALGEWWDRSMRIYDFTVNHNG